MKAQQNNIFGISRIDFNEQIELTVRSLNEYGPRHDHWAIAWSWGKDSTTLVTLIVSLIESGQIAPPKSLTVLCADTRMELTPLWIAAQGVIEKLRAKGITVNTVMAPIEERFLVYILGRGVPPPSNTFRWCTGQIKVEPMHAALKNLHAQIGQKILMLTGVRQGESAIRDGRISMSCSKDGSECGQGWYQTGNYGDMCATLAPIIHWRVCSIWDWLKIFAPMKQHGSWPTAILADAYGGDEAEEINARTGCTGCPLASKDKALIAVVKMPQWTYLNPLLRLKEIYREMRLPQYRHRKNGELKKDGTPGKNQQRLGPLTLHAREKFLEMILEIQHEVNLNAITYKRPLIDILNEKEVRLIRKMIRNRVFPDRWTGEEITGDIIIEKKFKDGTIQAQLFPELINQKAQL